MVRAIIFDCFGVIVGQGFEYTYRMAGGDPKHDRAFIEDMLGQANFGLISDDDFRSGMAEKLGVSVDEWRQAVRTAERADAGLLTYVKQLRANYKTAVLSNANKGVLERKIGRERLYDCFDVVVASAEVGMVKPDPRIYRHAAEQLDVEPAECVFIDDSQLFVDQARELGMQAILYQNFAQLRADLTKILADSKS